MKKGLGLLAILASGAAYVAYKAAKKHDEENLDKDGADIILHNVDNQEFKPMDVDEVSNPETNTSKKRSSQLDEGEKEALRTLTDTAFAAIEQTDDDEEKPIQHTIYFAKEIELEEFKNLVISEGYVVTAGSDEHELLVLHISKISRADIFAKVLYLANLAKAHGGEYKGWICK